MVKLNGMVTRASSAGVRRSACQNTPRGSPKSSPSVQPTTPRTLPWLAFGRVLEERIQPEDSHLADDTCSPRRRHDILLSARDCPTSAMQSSEPRRRHSVCSRPQDTLQRNKTFQLSEDWYCHVPHLQASHSETACSAMPATSPRQTARLRSGRMTENSEAWIRCWDGDAVPGPSIVAACQDAAILRGRRVGIMKDPDHAKGRLQLDASQQATSEHNPQRRHSPAAGTPPEALTSIAGSPRSSPQSSHRNTYQQHVTSPECAAALRPDATGPVLQKYIVGTDIVDWQSFGRRAADACVEHDARASAQQSAPVLPFTARHHLDSVVLRQHLAQQPPVSLRGAGQVVHAPSAEPQSPASRPSRAKYCLRAAGGFSPQARRTPAAQVLLQ